MTTDTTEKGLEVHITQYLVDENKYILRENKQYNNVDCLDTELLFEFLEATQPKQVAKLKAYHKDLYEAKIIKRLNNQIKAKGVIEVLRKGIVDGFTDTKIRLFYDKPVSSYNIDAKELYSANKFSVMRQVYYSTRNKNSLDMVVFINGIPLITFELKNELTKQNVTHAINQYKTDRDPNEEIFQLGRLIVNFAVDTEEVWMCTQLKGDKSFFLPFNKGYNNGAGNPPNGGIKTDYLWKDILQKATLTNIIQNYTQLVTEEKEYTDEKGKKRIKKEKKLIFPRFHQFDAVCQLLNDAQKKGTGQKYLIQHSAGSGKSNSISWLAHQLIGLHDKSGQNNIFDTVIVVTDRIVLDVQIRNNIKQFQQVSGVVEAITDGSKHLKQALEEGKRIVITTIHKFKHIVEEIGELPGNSFAIIIDEAHSSLSGQMARQLNETLAKVTDEEQLKNDLEGYDEFEDGEVTGEDLIRLLIKSRKLLPNASYFAFTATPKNKTLELFGLPYQDGDKTKFKAFHLYSMKQAIEEGFIRDVLLNYTTYQSYYALLKKIEDDPEYDKKKAQKKLKAYVESHEHAINKKAELMIEHFMDNVVRKKKMGGLAKAMMVTSSRKNAVQTLSRLNRAHPLKTDTFVLDFANSAEDIEKAFTPYFASTILGEATDPNKLFDLQDALDNYQVYDRETVEEFSNKILANVSIDKLHDLLNIATDVFHNNLEEEQQADFRAKVKTYVRLYIFLSQIVPFENPYLERLYIFLNHLQNKLGGEAPVDLAKGILENINMDSYRLQLEGTTSVVLEQGEDLKPMPTDMRGGINDTEMDRLSNILQTFNDRYGTQFEDTDKVRQMAENIASDVAKNNELINSIKFSDEQNARITSDKIVGEELLKHITTNFDLYKLYSDNQEFKEDFSAMMFGVVKELISKGLQQRL